MHATLFLFVARTSIGNPQEKKSRPTVNFLAGFVDFLPFDCQLFAACTNSSRLGKRASTEPAPAHGLAVAFVTVIPAQAGIYRSAQSKAWIPACAGMTG